MSLFLRSQIQGTSVVLPQSFVDVIAGTRYLFDATQLVRLVGQHHVRLAGLDADVRQRDCWPRVVVDVHQLVCRRAQTQGRRGRDGDHAVIRHDDGRRCRLGESRSCRKRSDADDSGANLVHGALLKLKEDTVAGNGHIHYNMIPI